MGSGPLGEMQGTLIPWLGKKKYSLLPLVEWLMGYNLPPVGDEVPAYIWLMDAVGQQPHLVRELAKRSAEATSQGIWARGGLSDQLLGKHLDKNARRRLRKLVHENLFYLLVELLKNLIADASM
jgi:hypothetical protein